MKQENYDYVYITLSVILLLMMTAIVGCVNTENNLPKNCYVITTLDNNKISCTDIICDYGSCRAYNCVDNEIYSTFKSYKNICLED